MTTTKKRYGWSIIAVAVLLATFAAYAGAHPAERLFDRLDLDEAQRQSLVSLRVEFETSREAAMAQREEVEALIKDGNVDAAADSAANYAREHVYQRAEMRRRLAEILTPEQLAEFDELRAEGPGFRHRGGPRGRR